MSEARPNVVILAGPNGAGKSTAAPELLQGALGVNEFVNADVIARGLVDGGRGSSVGFWQRHSVGERV
jgi:predicted ABC-type ATPase